MIRSVKHVVKRGSERRAQSHQKSPDIVTRILAGEMNAGPVPNLQVRLW